MSVNGIGSGSNISAIYQNWLKQLQQQQQADSTDAAQSGAAASASTDTAAAQQSDAKSLLSRLAASQPSLLDYLSGNGSDSDGVNSDDSTSSDASSNSNDPETILAGIMNFDPNTAALKAFATADSDSGTNTDADSDTSDPYASLMSAYNLGSSDISALLDKLYSQADVNAPSLNGESGNTGGNSGTGTGQTGDTQK